LHAFGHFTAVRGTFGILEIWNRYWLTGLLLLNHGKRYAMPGGWDVENLEEGKRCQVKTGEVDLLKVDDVGCGVSAGSVQGPCRVQAALDTLGHRRGDAVANRKASNGRQVSSIYIFTLRPSLQSSNPLALGRITFIAAQTKDYETSIF
jgi:hypothetical protein